MKNNSIKFDDSKYKKLLQQIEEQMMEELPDDETRARYKEFKMFMMMLDMEKQLEKSAYSASFH